MSDEINNGGPAFPSLKGFQQNRHVGQEYLAYSANSEGGMSLRDYFAGQALAGILSGDMKNTLTRMAESKAMSPSDAIAVFSYQAADAMLAERERAK